MKAKPQTLTPEETAAALKSLDALEAQGKTYLPEEAPVAPAGPKPSTTAPYGGRRKDGTFAAGNQAAKGNPFARQVARLRSVLLESVTENDLRAIVQAVLDKARGGDLAAAKMVFDYTTGKPRGTPDPDKVDAEENELRERLEKSAPSTHFKNPFKKLPGWCA